MSDSLVQALPRAPADAAAARLSLRTQLSFSIALVLLLVLSAAVLIVIHQARLSVQRETAGVLDFAGGLLDEVAAEAAPGVLARTIAETAARLDAARHLCVKLDAAAAWSCSAAPPQVPAWFARAVTPPQQRLQRRYGAGDTALALTLAADPGDEIAEAWDDARDLLWMIVLVTVAVQLLGFVLITRGLRPVADLERALLQLREGEHAPLQVRRGAPDLQRIAAGIEALRQRLAATRADNHRLLQRCLETQEEERAHLARELHDELGQCLTAVEAELAALQAAPRAASAALSLQAARHGVRDASASLQHLLRELRPGGLDQLGLAAALQQLAADWQRRLPRLRIVCDIDAAVKLEDATVALHLFRIAQEALTNVARHAEADEVLLCLREDDGGLHLTVADDGRGLRASTASRRGLGLVGMRERAAALRASLRIDSQPRRGCRIEVGLPRRR